MSQSPTGKPSIVVVGGGTGTAVVLSGLKAYPVALSAVVAMGDSGGSTGRLRDEFGFLPVGDLRQALAALANQSSQAPIRELLLYRFTRGSGLTGHNFGNLLLTALQEITGSTAKAVDLATTIFRLEGQIYPSTNRRVELVTEYTDGSFVIGEHHLNPHQGGGRRIKRLHLSPQVRLYPPAGRAIQAADLVVVGPGDLYASLLPNLQVTGMKAVFRRLSAPVVYVLNLMTSYAQTHGLTARDHLTIIERGLGRPVDRVVVNRQPVPAAIRQTYRLQQEFPVKDDLARSPRIIRADLLETTPVLPQTGDRVSRSYLRHSPAALAKVIYNLLK